jgi:hypothetical protein
MKRVSIFLIMLDFIAWTAGCGGDGEYYALAIAS